MRKQSVLAVLLLAALQSAVAHAQATQSPATDPMPTGQLIVRKERRLAGLTIDVVSSTGAATPVGSVAPDVFEATIAVAAGTYQIRAAYLVGSRTVGLPLRIAVAPDSARAANDTVVVGENATPVIVDLALAEPKEPALELESVAARYERACEPAATGTTAWSVGERCANLAYIQKQKWQSEREALQRDCSEHALDEPCPTIAAKEAIWARARQSLLERGCRFGSPRACAAWDAATQAELDRECRAEKDTSWVACLRSFARDERPLFYDPRHEPPERSISRADSEQAAMASGDSLRVAIGISGWRSPERQNPIVVLPFAVRTTLLGHTPIGRVGLTGTFAPAVQHIPVLERGSKEVAGSYQLIGLQAEAGPSWSPFSFIRVDGSAFFQPTFNQSASSVGLKAELALILGDHALSALTGFARIANLTRDPDGTTRSSIGGADLTFYGVSYFYTVREE